MFRFCRDVCNDSYFAIFDSVCMFCFVRCLNHFVCLFYLINLCFEIFFIKMFDQMRFTLKIWSEIVCIDDVFFLISFDLQYFRIDFRCFSSNVRSEIASHEWRFLFKIFFVNANMIISEITILFHLETRTRFATMNEFKYRKSSSLFILFSDFWYVFAQSLINQTREFAHY